MRSGVIRPVEGVLREAGINGIYWSSQAHSAATDAYYLNFNAANANPSGNSNRYYGFSLRCLSTAVD